MTSNLFEIRDIILRSKPVKYEAISHFNPYTQGRIQQDFNSRADYGSSEPTLYTSKRRGTSQSSTYQITAQSLAGNYSGN